MPVYLHSCASYLDIKILQGKINVKEGLAFEEQMAIPPVAIARAIALAIEQLADVDVNEIVIRPTAQVQVRFFGWGVRLKHYYSQEKYGNGDGGETWRNQPAVSASLFPRSSQWRANQM